MDDVRVRLAHRYPPSFSRRRIPRGLADTIQDARMRSWLLCDRPCSRFGTLAPLSSNHLSAHTHPESGPGRTTQVVRRRYTLETTTNTGVPNGFGMERAGTTD